MQNLSVHGIHGIHGVIHLALISILCRDPALKSRLCKRDIRKSGGKKIGGQIKFVQMRATGGRLNTGTGCPGKGGNWGGVGVSDCENFKGISDVDTLTDSAVEFFL